MVGICQFQSSIGHLSQWTGREDCELEQMIVAISVGGKKVTQKAMHACHALLNFIYLAQYESHTPNTLNYLHDALELFHQNKNEFISLGARKPPK